MAKQITESHWKYCTEAYLEAGRDLEGFVYSITHKASGLCYIGRKYFWAINRIKTAGKKKRTVKISESDWKSYTGSSELLAKLIEVEGKEAFEFEIMAFGQTRGQVNYLEENIQHKLDVLTEKLPTGQRKYLNDSIGSRRYVSLKSTPFLENTSRSIRSMIS